MARAYLNSTVFDPVTGEPVSGIVVNVFQRGTIAPATLYSTETGNTTLANPLVTQAGGALQAWIGQGSYDLQISGTGITTYTQPFEAVSGANIIALTHVNFSAANVDGTPTTPSLRTLGPGANQALPGNTPLGGTPSGAAGGALIGNYPNPGINTTQSLTWTAEQTVTDLKITGLSGATTALRLVGGTSGGPPSSGTWDLLDVVADIAGQIWICVSPGTPGTWQAVGGQTLEAVKRIGDSGQPAFQNGWTNKPTWQAAGFLKDPYGIVHLMGTVQSGTVGSTIFTLPTGYRPLSTINPNNVQINSDGTVLGPSDPTTLDGITFVAGI